MNLKDDSNVVNDMAMKEESQSLYSQIYLRK